MGSNMGQEKSLVYVERLEKKTKRYTHSEK